MRIPKGDITKTVAFVAVDEMDPRVRLTDLSNFSVYYWRQGSIVSTAVAAPTIVQCSKLVQPGEYRLLVDRPDMVSQLGEINISIFHSGMLRTTRIAEIYWPSEQQIKNDTEQILLNQSTPAGLRTVQIQFYKTATVVPIPDVWITFKDATGLVTITSVRTDASGQATVALNDGTYKVYFMAPGYTFTQGQTLVVNSNENETYYGDAVQIGAPSFPNSCRVYEICMAQSGQTFLSSVTSTARIISLPEDISGYKFATGSVSGTYDAQNGVVYWDIVRGALAAFKVSELGVNQRVVVPDQVQARLGSLTVVDE